MILNFTNKIKEMDKLDELALFNIAIHLDVPNLLNLCKTYKRFNDKICTRDPIWKYLLDKEFNEEKDEFSFLNLRNRELFKLLYSLKRLKGKLKLEHNLLNFYKIKQMWLNYDELKEIPKEIEFLINLQELELHNNRLKEIAKEIGKLTNLKELYSYKNLLKEIPKEIRDIKGLFINN